jgi:hypothetical protein
MSNNQVRRPIYSDSVAAWKSYESHVGPLKKSLSATLS